MAPIDPRFQLAGLVVSREGDYSVRSRELDTYLDVTAEFLHESGRGVAYRKAAFAYLFERVS
jgi:hypothetical protein